MRQRLSLKIIGWLQALGLIGYCSLVSVVFWQGDKWFGKVANFWGPLLMLVILVTSALICGLMVFGYPAALVIKEKKINEAVRLVLYTAGWLLGLSLLIMLGIGLTRNF